MRLRELKAHFSTLPTLHLERSSERRLIIDVLFRIQVFSFCLGCVSIFEVGLKKRVGGPEEARGLGIRVRRRINTMVYAKAKHPIAKLMKVRLKISLSINRIAGEY